MAELRRIVSYPARPISSAEFGYNVSEQLDSAHVDLLVSGGGSIARTQFSWSSVEDYATGRLSLARSWREFLSHCARKGVKVAIVCAYGPPYRPVGTLTVAGSVPSGAPAGTPIPVKPYSFRIDFPYCFATAPRSSPSNATASISNTGQSYYGTLIASTDAGHIYLPAALCPNLKVGDPIVVNRLRYPPPSSDRDPSNGAFVRYATFVARQIASTGAKGWASIWNEYVWPNDHWDSLANFYDHPPSSITTSWGMRAILERCQREHLPKGVSFGNGVSDKTGFAGLLNQAIRIPGAITVDELHPYGGNPEQASWDYYSWGFHSNRPPPPKLNAGDPWWATLLPSDAGSNFRNMAFLDDLTPHAPHLLASECGFGTRQGEAQARYLARRVASLWGMGVLPVVYVLDDGSPVGSETFSVAPSSRPRQAYHALQRMAQLIGRMAKGSDRSFVPTVEGWPEHRWPLMTCTFYGAKGHVTMFLWQRTYDDTDDGSKWPDIPSPPAVKARVAVRDAASNVAEAFDVVTGHPVEHAQHGHILEIPVTDNVVAVRWSPRWRWSPR